MAHIDFYIKGQEQLRNHLVETVLLAYSDHAINTEKERTMIHPGDITSLTEGIVKEFQPEKVVLFGSHAYGTPRPDSDVDLLVILSFNGSGFRKSLEILNRLNPDFPIDLIVRKPQETEQRYINGDPLIREALDRGLVLYERCH